MNGSLAQRFCVQHAVLCGSFLISTRVKDIFAGNVGAKSLLNQAPLRNLTLITPKIEVNRYFIEQLAACHFVSLLTHRVLYSV